MSIYDPLAHLGVPWVLQASLLAAGGSAERPFAGELGQRSVDHVASA